MSEFLERIAQLSPKKLALLAAELRSRLDRAEQARIEPVAIVGLGCRLPGGVVDPASYWRLLRDGVDAVTEVPSDRWDVDACWSADPDEPGKMYTRHGAFLDRLDLFDAHFFGISPREAQALDPQQRLLLEVTWEALEHAGQSIDALQGSQTGIFVGVSTSNYLQRQLSGGRLDRLDTYLGTGNAVSVAAGRLSYTLGLQGPAISVDTACSSSLVAVHLACQSLLAGECRMALAGGANVILGPEWNVVLSKARMLAPDGRCKSFDASADGFGRGEGCGIVVLKRLADAQADGDRIMAVIRGTAVNQDGRSSGLTAPNGIAQEALIRQALVRARVAPAQVSYVEAHGTGTSLGDPIEIQAIGAALGEGRPADRPVLVGSVKSNVSHLEAAAGIAGLIKVVLALDHHTIPPNLHFNVPNPHIPWAELPVAVPTTASPWPAGNGPCIAGVSSFGFSGTNAHALIEEAPVAVSSDPAVERPMHIFTVSAKTEAALGDLSERVAGHLQDSQAALADTCFTANVGRAHFGNRVAVVGSSPQEIREKLIAGRAGESVPGFARGTVASNASPLIAFLFTGQGSQYVEMGRALFDTQPAFRRTLQRCDELLRPHLDRPLLSVLYPPAGESSPIDETAYTQPALFSFEYALAELWRAWGVEPALLLGHSIGEYVAACVAGVLTLEDALTLVAARGRLMQALPRDGAMAAIWADAARVQAAIARSGGRMSIAAINGPSSVVAAGPRADVEALALAFDREGVRAQVLNVSHAFHSPLIEPMLDEFERIASGLHFGEPRLAVVSNVTGRLVTGDEMRTPAYWRRHIREAVQFRAGMETLQAEGCTLFLEVGPTPTLLGLGRQCLPESTGAWLPSLRRGQDPWQSMLTTLGELYARGINVQWQAFDADYSRRKVVLPTYPFQRERFWIEAPALERAAGAAQERSSGPEVDDWLYEVAWQPKARSGATATATAAATQTWVIAGEAAGFAARLADQLAKDGARVVLAPSAEDAGAFDGPLAGVLYLADIDTPAAGADTAESLAAAHQRQCAGVLSAVRSLSRRRAGDRPRLWIVTRGAQPVSGSAAVLAGAAAWGLARTIAVEHPELHCACIDLDPIAALDEVETLCGEITGPDGENQIALRAGGRHVARLLPSAVPATVSSPVPSVRADRTYVITGGLGALGLHVARWLVARGARHLALIGRRGPSDAAVEVIREMEAIGANVCVARGDVARREDVATLLDRIVGDMPPLGGVIHAAGVIDDGVVIEQDWTRFEKVLAPKVAGAWHLHELTRDTPLDFFVLFSSMASVLGSAGQASYSAANAFLDALAYRRAAEGLPAVSVNWGPWADAGMAASLGTQNQQRLRRFGMEPMAPARALGAFERLLGTGRPQISVLPIRWRSLLDRLGVGETPPLFAELARSVAASPAAATPGPVQPDLLSRLEQTPRSKRRSLVQAHVREQVRQVLGVPRSRVVGLHDGFRELGMDSLMALELRNALQRTLGHPLPATLAFDFPTIDALTTYVTEEVLTPASDESTIDEQQGAADRPRGVDEPIAIIGLGCRLPGADGPDRFWELLRDGVDAISEVPRERWDIEALYDPDPAAPGKMYTRHGGFLRDVDQFDASFFGISPREAVSLDPQQRLLLEVSWEALEHAGQAPERLLGTKSGVFVGISGNDYGQLYSRRDDPDLNDAYVATGNALSVAAGRLSYVLGLQGPSMSVDTACSSSLVAVHLACQSLRAGECRVALAGGVNLTLVPDVTINLSRARMLAPDGRCKTFDAAADGYVRSEGAGMVVLKPLSDAIADGDRVLAVIRGSAVNQDGRSSGLTVPNGPSQQALIREALAAARVEPADVSYVEAHGTGTSLGDPIELQAIGHVLGDGRESDQPLVIGSVKTNVGHLESAAGVAGLIKVVLALQYEEIPPHLHFTRLNPHVAFDGCPAVIPTARLPWRSGDRRRVAGVSSFGFSGTNAHVVVEEAPDVRGAAGAEDALQVVTLSAKTAAALESLAGRLSDSLTADSRPLLRDLAFTLNAGRSHFAHRRAFIASSVDALRDQFAAAASGRSTPRFAGCLEEQEPPDVVFVFPGEGPSRAGVALQLYETEPTFRSELERCRQLLHAHLEGPLPRALDQGAATGADGTRHEDAAWFAIQYALSCVWRSWGIEPAAVAGHGVGEYVAGCVAGVFTLEDACRLVAARGRRGGRQPGAAAGAVFADIERVASEVTYSPARVPLASALTGELADERETTDPCYWSRSRPDTSEYARGIERLREHGHRLFIEMGGPSSATAAAPAADANGTHVLPSLAADGDDRNRMLESLCTLYVLGARIDWSAFHRHGDGRKIQLPTYPFQRRRYWIDTVESAPVDTESVRAYAKAVQIAQRAALEGPLDLALHTYPVKWRCSERLSIAYMLDALRRFRCFTAAGETHTAESVLREGRILPAYAKLVGRWLQTLSAEGILLQDGERYTSAAPLPTWALEPLVAETRDAFSEAPLLATYLEGCGTALADVLTGKQSALETLFPRGSFTIADALYNTCPVARYTGAIVRQVVQAFAAGTHQSQGIRLLEIGAGTGGTAATLLPVVPANRTSYYFTDVSDFFLARAEEKFREYPFVRYGLLDAERDPQDQGYPAGAFDLVVSVNALHATRNLEATMRRARGLLRPGGMIVLSESTAHPIWFDVTVGLIEGWQLFEDKWRKDNPLLSPSDWRELLTSTGFEDVCIVPEAGSPAEIVGQSVLVARAPFGSAAAAARAEIVLDVRSQSLPRSAAAAPADVDADGFVRRLTDAVPAEREELLIEYVRDHVTRVLRLDPAEAPTRRQRLMDLGVDSLMAVELRNRLASGLDAAATLPATLMFDYPTIEAIARYLGTTVLAFDDAAAVEVGPDSNGSLSDAAERVAALSDEEAEALLIQRLESL